jgi:hypothetical protein
VNATGTVSLDGTLDVTLLDLQSRYLPSSRDRFEILTSTCKTSGILTHRPLQVAKFHDFEDSTMWMTLFRGIIAGAVVMAVTELSRKYPRVGALLLTLPLVSILAFVMTWTKHEDLPSISRLAKETLVLVPLGLPFFLPIAFADRFGLSFWPALIAGIVLAAGAIGTWYWLGPALD